MKSDRKKDWAVLRGHGIVFFSNDEHTLSSPFRKGASAMSRNRGHFGEAPRALALGTVACGGGNPFPGCGMPVQPGSRSGP